MTGHFEAKKHGYRQTQDGVVVSFVLHPNDLDASFAIAALGTRYMVAFAEIGDDEKPIRPRNSGVERHGEGGLSTTTPIHAEGAGSNPAGAANTRKAFGALPLSQQAALRCNDDEFRHFLVYTDYDGRFKRIGWSAADEVRYRCGVESRSEFDKNFDKGLMWRGVEEQFQAWLTDKRYADVKR